MMVNLILSYEYMGQYGRQIEKKVSNIATHYFYTNFFKDLLALIPF